ncbi:MAG TPA: SdrD B-like domain-containing protein [Ferruginibacter sp.]|jgi:hypothetical protein|nr:SdrD B-like domain-containing protein [Ferruginibacter sp.]
MRKKLLHLFHLIIFVLTILPIRAQTTQGFINYSTYLGGSAADNATCTQIVNGEVYVLATTASANYPVTNGSHYSGSNDAVVTKFNRDGTIAFSTYVGGSGNDNFSLLQIVNGNIFIAGSTSSANFPVTNGSTYSGANDIIVVKLNATGSITFASYYGGSNDEFLTSYNAIQVFDNYIYIAGTTISPNFPVVNGRPYGGGTADVFVIKLNTIDGSTAYSTCIGGTGDDEADMIQMENGQVYITGPTTSADLPVTIGSSFKPGPGDLFVASLNADGSIGYVTYLGSSGQDLTDQMLVVNGEVYLTGYAGDHDFPTTDGSTFPPYTVVRINPFITKFDANGNIVFSKLTQPVNPNSTSERSNPVQIKIAGNNLYLLDTHNDLSNANNDMDVVLKLNAATGDIIYSTVLGGVNLGTGFYNDIEILNDEVYINGVTTSPGYPNTNGSTYYSAGTGFFSKLNTNGDIVFSGYLGAMGSISPMQIIDNKIYMAGNTNTASYAVTNGSSFSGTTDNILLVFNTDGSTNFATYLGGSNTEADLLTNGVDYSLASLQAGLLIDSSNIYLIGTTTSIDYPVTNNSTYKGNNDIFVTKIVFCPFDYAVSNDTLSPSVQTTCKLGLGELITGKSILIKQNEAPVLYRNGVPQTQNNTEASYQWQTATDPSGPWTNINTAGATKNYLPTGGNATLYYRRLAYTLPNCGNPAIDTSAIDTVLVNNNIAPVVNTGGNFYTCPGTAITIGGSPTVSGGTPPYSFSWDMGAGIATNPAVSPAVNTVYTATVTDSLGCQQLGQAIVNSYKADAGPDKSTCAGTPVQIGTAGISGLPGITYSWVRPGGLSDASIAQPLANATVTETYALTVTLPLSGGGTCSTTDTVIVTPVAAPAADFAGSDQVICLGDSVMLGLPAVAGYTYTWAPGNYLQSNNNSTATFYAGNINMPIPNPGIIYVTAAKDGCSFTDQTTVAVIEARASDGTIYCGPRIVGLPDRTPGINETYTWTKVSGPGNFTGAIDQPQVPVSASVGGSTIYELTTSYNGHSCTDEVSVPECDSSGCQTKIHVSAKYGCPSFSVNGGNVTLSATCSVPNVTFKWSPTVGLSDSIGNSVQLTDNIPRIYTATAVSIADTSVEYCSKSAQVNDPASMLPVFAAANVTACANQPVTIGAAPVAGYSYLWTGTVSDLSSTSIANPTATLTASAKFPVQISDTTGCTIYDTVAVNVEQINVDVFPTRLEVCNNAIIQLGAPALPGITYSWSPSNAPWQNGTDSSSADPEVLIAGSQFFTRVATTPSGCSQTDITHILVNNSPVLANAPDTTICLNKGVQIGSPALAGVTYSWTPATGLSDPNTAQPLATPNSTTTYTVNAIFPGTCSTATTDQVIVTVSDPTFTLPDIDYCPSGGAVFLGTGAPTGMSLYAWSPADEVSSYLTANPTTLNPPPSSSATYTLTVVNAKGCQASSTVTINPKQSPPIAGSSSAVCLNNTVSLGSATNETGAGISYQWSPATYLDNSTSIAPTFTATDTGTFTYTVTKTDATLSCISTATVTVTVNNFTLPIISAATICQNSCKEIGTASVAGAHYAWSPSAGLSDPTLANPVACVGTANASYSLLATGPTGCTATASVLVSVSPTPAPEVTIPSITVCSGTDSVAFDPTVTPSGAYNYVWSPDDASLSNIYAETPNIYLTSTGSKQYTLTVTDPVSGCTNTATTSLIVNTCSSLAEIGDYVWYDDDQNGLQDINELGVSGVTVTAYNSLNFAVAMAITDATGHYTLKDIQPGAGYYIIFSRPSDYNFTIQNVGGIASINNSKPDITGRTATFTVNAGDTITNIDAGIVPAATVLPITLTNFAGQLYNNEVTLNWQTSAEFNNHYFIVEKSIDGINYTAIGTVNGSGTTTFAHSYSFVDTQPASGNNYYRLIQVDDDNSTAYSKIIIITSTNVNQSITAVYLPQQNVILVTFSQLQKGNVWFNLFADNGQLISSTSAENIITEKINTNTLATGVYMLQTISNNNNYTRKVFVNK